MSDIPFHSGFVCLIGRPNVGKSTLTNALVGGNIAITSPKPQTTRHTIRGIVHRADGQIIIVDTPGLHRPRTLLGERLNALVIETFHGVDIVTVCLPANEKLGPGDAWIVQQVQQLSQSVQVLFVVTKTDTVSAAALAKQLLHISGTFPGRDIIPVSIHKPDSVQYLLDFYRDHLQEGPAYYPDGEMTDEPDETLMAEFIREAALEGMEEELPHSIAVTIEEMQEKKDRLVIYANIFLERDSQKAIIIGRGGSRLKVIGTAARQKIERVFGVKVYLDVRVKVAKDWQRDPNQLGKLGF